MTPEQPSGQAGGEDRLRVVMFPDLVSPDPYCRLLDGALTRRGIDVRRGRRLDRSFAREAGGCLDAVHLHWIELLFWPGGRGRLRQLASMRAQAREAVDGLRALRDAGVRIVWTVHNPPSLPGSSFPGVHLRLQREVAQAADTVLVHSDYAAREAQRSLAPPAVARVVPHGGYAGAYPPPRHSREQTRRRLGLAPEAFVYLLFGTLRAYKQVPEAIRAFRELPDPRARLLVAGAPGDLGDATERAGGGDPRVALELRHIPEAEVAELFQAADVFVINYAEVFSSGALLLALCFGLPVVAPANGSATELAPPPATIAFSAGGLREALALAPRDHDPRRQAARAAGRVPSWDRTAALLEDIYRGAPGERRPDQVLEVAGT